MPNSSMLVEVVSLKPNLQIFLIFQKPLCVRLYLYVYAYLCIFVYVYVYYMIHIYCIYTFTCICYYDEVVFIETKPPDLFNFSETTVCVSVFIYVCIY